MTIARLFLGLAIVSSLLGVLAPLPAAALTNDELEKKCFSQNKNALIPLPGFKVDIQGYGGPECQDYRVVLMFLKKATNTAIQFVLAIALIFLIITGYQFITSVGDKTGMENAKRSILYIIIGILAVLGAFMLVTYISNQFLDLSKISSATPPQ